MKKLAKKKGYAIDEKNVKIVTTDERQIQGVVNAAEVERTSDLFTKDKAPFIIVYKAIAKGGENKVLVINKNQIVWAELEVGDDS